jgi:lipoprotein-anchoring transpeptidase ErfK/SrfK
MRMPFQYGLLCAAAAALTGCATFEQLQNPQARQAAKIREQHAAFRAQEGWRKLTYRHTELLSRATKENSAVEISLEEQRGLLLVDGAVAMDFPVATGKASHPTPKGSYKIIEKKEDHKSNLYGRMVSGEGQTVVSDADTRDHAVPQGGRFVGAPMPYWMRLTTTGVGMHVGYVPGRPASHGCIRLKKDVAVELFGILDLGSPVTIDSQAPSLGGSEETEKVASGEAATTRASG